MKDKLRELSKVERVRLFVNASDENLKIPTRVLNWLSDYADILDAEEGGYWPDGSDAPIRDYTPAQVPDGWKLVPVEPTNEMIASASKLSGETGMRNAGVGRLLRRDYAAMLSAAPPAPKKD